MAIAPIQPKQIDDPVTSPARFERKYFIPPSKVALAGHLLGHCCVRDREYPRSLVHSVYYDTPNLDCLADSEEGNYNRYKVRLRWYDRPWDTSSLATVYLELKGKQGFAGTKTRQAFVVSSKVLARIRPSDRILSDIDLHHTLARFNSPCHAQLQPTVCIVYDRMRYIDRLTGLRLSLDWHIRSIGLSPACGRQEAFVSMAGAVLEIKGPSMAMPPTLDALRVLGTDWTRYSKYAGCLTTHFETAGAVGRLSPSGRIVAISA